MPVLCSRRVEVQARAERVGTTFDPIDVGAGEEFNRIGGQAGKQLCCGALAANSTGPVQSWRALTLGRVLVEPVDVGEFGSARLESGDDRPVAGFAQRDGVHQIVISDLDGGIQQPRRNGPVRHQLRMRQQFLGGGTVSIFQGASEVETAAPAHIADATVTTVTGFTRRAQLNRLPDDIGGTPDTRVRARREPGEHHRRLSQ